MKIFQKALDRYIKWRRFHSIHYFKKFLQRKGVKVGKNIRVFGKLSTIDIDVTRPSLVVIGNDVCLNRNFKLFTHDYVTAIFIAKYKDFINSSGKVIIGNNVSFGSDCTVLKGVTIGDNSFIAAGSIVASNIPANSIAGGIPAKVICTIDQYYEKRKKQSLSEAFEYAKSIVECYNRRPIPEDFKEEFHFFVDKTNVDQFIHRIPIKKQLGPSFNYWLEHHNAQFKSFEDFLKAAEIG